MHAADAQRVREAVAAILRLDDPGALRSLAVVLKTGTRRERHTAIDALIATQDHRASALLASALRETRPIGEDHQLALQLLAALRRVGDEHAVPAIAESMQAVSWVRLAQTISLKRTAVSVLASMNNARAPKALTHAARHGDLLLRRCARTAMRARG